MRLLLKEDEDDDFKEYIRRHADLYLRFCRGNHKAQQYLIGGIEKLIYEDRALMAKIHPILECFWSEKILSRSVLLKWHEKVIGYSLSITFFIATREIRAREFRSNYQQKSYCLYSQPA